MYIVLYNPIAGNERARREMTESVSMMMQDTAPPGQTALLGHATKFIDILKVDFKKFFSEINKDDDIIISGGDGTLTRFLNDTANIPFSNKIYHWGMGSGNDFLRDILGHTEQKDIVNIDKYIDHLPEVTVKGKTFKFLNGIGFGIDGYFYETADKLRQEGKADFSYSSIAVNGLMFHYKPTNAVVTVDGNRREFKKVWLASTMNGKYYGGGMMPTPEQDRLNKEGHVQIMIFHNANKIKLLSVFPSLFKGEHVKHKNNIEIITGDDITVEFDRPSTLQIDGETVPDVTGYHVKSRALTRKKSDIFKAQMSAN